MPKRSARHGEWALVMESCGTDFQSVWGVTGFQPVIGPARNIPPRRSKTRPQSLILPAPGQEEVTEPETTRGVRTEGHRGRDRCRPGGDDRRRGPPAPGSGPTASESAPVAPERRNTAASGRSTDNIPAGDAVVAAGWRSGGIGTSPARRRARFRCAVSPTRRSTLDTRPNLDTLAPGFRQNLFPFLYSPARLSEARDPLRRVSSCRGGRIHTCGPLLQTFAAANRVRNGRNPIPQSSHVPALAKFFPCK